MTPDRKRSVLRLDYALVGIMVLMLVTVAAVFAEQLSKTNQQLAQATSPQTEPTTPSVPAGKDKGPAESKPGGTRPTTPPPEPARPDPDAQKQGAKPALPPAPAEKMGDPIKR